MKNSQSLKNGFYIKVNKKKLLKEEKSPESDSLIKKQSPTKEFNIQKSIYLIEAKNNSSEINHIYSPINKQKIFKNNKFNDKSIKKINTTPTNKKYNKKIIHLENRNNLYNLKGKTEFPLNNKNYFTKSEKNSNKSKKYFSQKNLRTQKTNVSKKINIKGNTDLKEAKNFLINYEQNSAYKLSPKNFRNNLYYPNSKSLIVNKDNNKYINKNINYIISIPENLKTNINNYSQINNKKIIGKKIKNNLKEKQNVIYNINNNKKMIDIYKEKLITIFVKLMRDFFKKQIKRIFNIFIYILKDDFYFSNNNKTYNKNQTIINNISKNKIYDYNCKINYKYNIGNNIKKSYLPCNDFQSMTMYHMCYNKKENNNNENKMIYIPTNNRYEKNYYNNEIYYNNYHSNPKYNIFNDMKIEKNTKNIDEANNIYNNQNINTQINNYYNTKNTNYYFNKVDSFTSLIIEKRRPRYYYPKNNIKHTSPENSNNISLNNRKSIYINETNIKKTNLNNDYINPENKSKILIYKKIISKDNKNKYNDENYVSTVNRTEKIANKKSSFINYKNILIKDKEYVNNYYTTIAQNIKENNNEDISNDMNNYYLEDIDKPMNMIYSKNDFDEYEEENNINQNNKIYYSEQIITPDRRLFMNFNYIIFNQKKRGQYSIYKNKNKMKKDILYITKVESIFLLNTYEKSNKINNVIIEKLDNIINQRISKYKTIFIKTLKNIKFKSIVNALIMKHNKIILQKFFNKYKIITHKKEKKVYLKSNGKNKINYSKINLERKKENNFNSKNYIDNIYDNKFELFRINLLKYIFRNNQNDCFNNC